MENKAFELILHPIRMRIMQAYLGGRKFTASKLVEIMPEIPQATLYRHIKKLSQAGVLQVVEENQIRGTVEKVYALAEDKVHMTPEDVKNMKPEDHMRYFTAFVTSLLGEFQNYIQKGGIDVIEDGLSYRKASVYLNDEEFKDLMLTIGGALTKIIDNKPTADRRLRNITTIIIPE